MASAPSTLDLPRRPKLAIHGSYLLSKGEFLSATCSACVGTGGQLVWTLLRGRDELQWSSQFAITQRMSGISGVPIKQSNITYLVERNYIIPIQFFLFNNFKIFKLNKVFTIRTIGSLFLKSQQINF